MLKRNSFVTRGFLFDAACICLALLFGAAFLFTGCTDIADSESASTTSGTSTGTTSGTSTGTATSGTTTSGSTTTSSTAASWTYAASSPVYEVDSDVSSVSISGLTSGQTIYLAKTNVSSTAIDSSYARYVSAAANVTLTSAVSSSGSTTAPTTGGHTHGPGSEIKYFVAPEDFSDIDAVLARTASSRSSSASVTQIDRTIGTTKNIYVDTNSSLSSYSQKSATLRAVGTYCNVWVVDDYYSTTASSSVQSESVISSTSAIAQNYADFFDAMYPVIKNVFGDESDALATGTSLSSASDTGTYVNIVLYDIGGDDGSDGSVVGYFYNKDYYPASSISYSNVGKYFYVDSYFANDYSEMTYSTLAHEFQHMIDFNTKNIEHGISPSTWYNEMLSMLCEDMMQSQLGIDDEDSPKGRLPTFSQYYRYVGLEYKDSSTSYQIISYATAYAFGCWLSREFGGAALLKEMSTNSSVNYTSVVNAVNTVNGTSYTIEDLLRLYAEACIFSNYTTVVQSYTACPSFNKDAAQAITYSSGSTEYAYPMTAVNLWSEAFEWLDTNSGSYCNTSNGTGSVTSSGTTYTGTYYFGPALYGYNAAYEIRPYGMTLCKVGTATGSTATITFSTTGTSSEHLYVMVQ